MDRIQTAAILKDLQKKMVLIAGPRQAGKTTVAREVAKHFNAPLYLNYDNIQDRHVIHQQAWVEKTDLLILDELHKMEQWKNYLKGVYDTKNASLKILVTGSARLDVLTHVGDSLAGRYFLHHLFPLSPAELHQLHQPFTLDQLLERSGFPEPYLAESSIEANRWRLQYTNSMLSTDVFDIELIHNLRALKTIFELLRVRVGAPVSYQSLAEDVAVSPQTVKKYIDILEALYVVFRVTPFSKNIARSLLKEPKIYFFDTGLVANGDGAQLENMAALSLLKHVVGKIDYHAENYALHYLRDKEGREVDFVIVKDHAIQQLVEIKMTNEDVSKSLSYFSQKYNLPAIQLVKNLRNEYKSQNISILKAQNWLSELFL